MARYNSVLVAGTQNGATTISTPAQGLFTEFTGTAPYTVTIPDPTLFIGTTQSFYNSTSGNVTISTPSGLFRGPSSSGNTTQVIPTLSTITLGSDGTNYIVLAIDGGPLQATTLSASSTVTLSPASANVVLSPTGTGVVTINPATLGSMNNVTIGATTAADATINTLNLNTALNGNGTINGGTF